MNIKRPTSHEPSLLLLGKNIPWNRFLNHPFKITNCFMLAKIEQDKIVSLGPPYALLIVESPYFKKETGADGLMMVDHPVDFRHLWIIFKERTITDEEEVWVEYSPIDDGIKSMFATWLAKLKLYIYPKGSLNTLHNTTSGEPKIGRRIAAWYNG